jgi:hypothetical protein
MIFLFSTNNIKKQLLRGWFYEKGTKCFTKSPLVINAQKSLKTFKNNERKQCLFCYIKVVICNGG